MWTMKIQLKSKDEFGYEIIEKVSMTAQEKNLKDLYDRLMSIYIAEGKKVQNINLFENEKPILRAVMRGNILCIDKTKLPLASWIRERMKSIEC